MLKFFSSNWKIDFVIIYTSLCQQQPRRRRYSSSMDGRGGGDAVDNILFFPDSSRLCSIYDRMSCDFFFYLNTFLTRRSGITFGSFFGNEVIYTTTVMFIKNSLVDLDLIWFEQIWCHWRQTGQKMKKINSFYSEPNVATIPKRFSTFSQKSKKM